MQSIIRGILVVVGIVLIGLSVGFFLQLPWVIWAWPWPDKSLSYAFVAAMQAAIAAACLWIAITGELAAIAAGALNLLVMMGGLAVYLSRLALETQDRLLIFYMIICALFAALNFLIFLWARSIPFRDARPMPALVRFSYIIFVLALTLVGIALLLQLPDILPWEVDAPVSVVLGWMFLGDAFYFLYALWQPRWYGACAQLWSFLAYDLVLLGPFLFRLPNVPSVYRDNLIVYVTILLYSGALAIYYLLINRDTRIVRVA